MSPIFFRFSKLSDRVEEYIVGPPRSNCHDRQKCLRASWNIGRSNETCHKSDCWSTSRRVDHPQGRFKMFADKDLNNRKR